MGRSGALDHPSVRRRGLTCPQSRQTIRETPRTKEWLGTASRVIFGSRPVPDKGLGCDVDIVWPDEGPIDRANLAEDRVVLGDPREDRPIEQVAKIAFDLGPVTERDADGSTVQRDDGNDAKHSFVILAKRLDSTQWPSLVTTIRS